MKFAHKVALDYHKKRETTSKKLSTCCLHCVLNLRDSCPPRRILTDAGCYHLGIPLAHGILRFLLILWFQQWCLFRGQLIYSRAYCHFNCFYSFKTQCHGWVFPLCNPLDLHVVWSLLPGVVPSSFSRASFMGMWPRPSHRVPHSEWLPTWFNALLSLSCSS